MSVIQMLGKYCWIGIVILAVMLAIFGVIGDHGVLKLIAINEELKEVEQKNETIESDIRDLKNKIYAVQNDKFTLEKRAREELGLANKDEIVYILPDSDARPGHSE